MIKNVYAKDKRGNEFKISDTISNNSEAYVGQSGTGKTTAIIARQNGMVKEGMKIITYNHHGSGLREKLPEEIRTEYELNVTRVNIKEDGLRIPPNITCKEIEATFVASLKLSGKRASIFGLAAEKANETGELEKGMIESISKNLEMINTKTAQDVHMMLSSHFADTKVIVDETHYDTAITELNFDGLLPETQTNLIEFDLRIKLLEALNGRFLDQELVLVIDECQKLSFGKNSVLKDLLELGRKQHVRLLLASPELPFGNKSASALAAKHCATTAYFRPGSSDIGRLAKMICPTNVEKWILELNSLNRGEFVAMGQFQNEAGTVVNGPIIMTMS